MKKYTEEQIEKMSKIECYKILMDISDYSMDQLDEYYKNHGQLFAQLKLYSFLESKGLIK